ncbi:hypothetical protein EV127DRAFT_409964 [Xylaria flabelliformis]|nr:hypothetical protein EV127DRAFT_409964 [Xylaria flabelliformis]
MSYSAALIISSLATLALGAPLSRENGTIIPAHMVNATNISFPINVTTIVDTAATEVAHSSLLTASQIAGIAAGAILALIPLGFLIWCLLVCFGCVGRRPGHRWV